jgi:hypothetical protein
MGETRQAVQNITSSVSPCIIYHPTYTSSFLQQFHSLSALPFGGVYVYYTHRLEDGIIIGKLRGNISAV